MSEGDKYIGLTVGEIEAQRANDRQVGGSHYKKGKKQHWDIVDEYGVPYLEGVASKYPLRWREKGGIEDLEKTLHYIDKILERPHVDSRWARILHLHTSLVDAARKLVEDHGCGVVEATIVQTLLCGFNRTTLIAVRRDLERYIAEIREQSGPGTPEDGGHHARQTIEKSVRHGDRLLLIDSVGTAQTVRQV